VPAELCSLRSTAEHNAARLCVSRCNYGAALLAAPLTEPGIRNSPSARSDSDHIVLPTAASPLEEERKHVHGGGIIEKKNVNKTIDKRGPETTTKLK
jgi:hypothetical protein